MLDDDLLNTIRDVAHFGPQVFWLCALHAGQAGLCRRRTGIARLSDIPTDFKASR
jgi:hypothetical protein